MEKAKPGPEPEDTSQRWEVTPKAAALAQAGISTSTAQRYEELAGPVVVRNCQRWEHRKPSTRNESNRTAPVVGPFDLVLADPPWRYEAPGATTGRTGSWKVLA
jgi:hypothetical protein